MEVVGRFSLRLASWSLDLAGGFLASGTSSSPSPPPHPLPRRLGFLFSSKRYFQTSTLELIDKESHFVLKDDEPHPSGELLIEHIR